LTYFDGLPSRDLVKMLAGLSGPVRRIEEVA
jgi:hypothetical protein